MIETLYLLILKLTWEVTNDRGVTGSGEVFVIIPFP